jgi:hypothetical protein
MFDNFRSFFLCIYLLLVTCFGSLPAYQFSFSCLHVVAGSGDIFSNSSTATTSDLFSNRFGFDTLMLYVCSTAIAIMMLVVKESVSIRNIRSPRYHWISQKLRRSELQSRQMPDSPAIIADEDVS